MAMVYIHLLMVKVFLILFKYGLYVLDVTYPKPFLDSTRTMSRNQNWEALNSFLVNSKEEWKKRSSTLGSFGSSRTVPSRPRTWNFDNFPIPSSAVHALSEKKSFDKSHKCTLVALIAMSTCLFIQKKIPPNMALLGTTCLSILTKHLCTCLNGNSPNVHPKEITHFIS